MSSPSLSSMTTLGVGGRPKSFAVAETTEQLIDFVRQADQDGTPILLIGGGSNLLVSDDGFDGLAIKVATKGISAADACGFADLNVAAGEVWDDFVNHSVDQGYAGVEALTGIPGSVGATPIQNVGAYGQEVSGVITEVNVWDTQRQMRARLSHDDCQFSYRNSVFKANPVRYVVLDVTFCLEPSDKSKPIKYRELAMDLGVGVGDRAGLAQTRDMVRRRRAGKGMLLDPSDPDTNSAGSFFTNPIVSPEVAEQLPDDAPRFHVVGGFKLSAAWLIDQSGFKKGHGEGRARLSSKHTLALTNQGGATAADLLGLASEIRDGVQDKFGIELVPEPNLVNCSI